MFQSSRNSAGSSSFKPKVRFGSKRSAKRQLPPASMASKQPPMTLATTTTTTASNTISGFSQVEIEELKQSFQLFDTEGTGRVIVGTVLNVLQTLQEEGTPYPHLENLIFLLSERDPVEQLELKDYLELMEMTSVNYALRSDADEATKLAHVFDLFDVDKKGYIDLDDLQRIALELGEQDMTREELAEMIEHAAKPSKRKSKNKNKGKVSLDDFINMMTLDLTGTRETATD